MVVDILDENNEQCFQKGSSCRWKEEIPGTSEQLRLKEFLFLQLQYKVEAELFALVCVLSVGIR